MKAAEIAAALERSKLDVLRYLLPHGRVRGHEYCAGSLSGDKGASLKVNVNGKGCVWADFAADEKGADLLDLWAASRCRRDLKAAMREACDWLGIRASSTGEQKAQAPRDERPTPHPKLGEPAGIWPYYNATGGLIGHVARFNRPDGKKEFRTALWRGSRWDWSTTFAKPRPLYRQPDLAANSAAPVLLVEGEKAADAALEVVAGFVPTTWPGGSSGVEHADFSPLKGRDVVLWPDADEPGRKAMAAAARLLAPIARSVRLVELPPDAPDGWDIADPMPATWGDDALERLTSEAKPVTPAPGEHDHEHGHDDWPDPNPIIAELKPVPAFDAETLLPEALRAWVMDEAERMPCPPEFVAAAALVALGSIIGARCAIKPKARDAWLIVPNLWGGIVGDPSAKKSPACARALKPLDRLVAKALEQHTAALADYETAKVVSDAQKEAIEVRIKGAAKKSSKSDLADIARELRAHAEQSPDAPVLRRFKTNDCTVEKLGELLRDNPAGMLVLRDELVGLIASWEREGHEGDRAFFLEGWNGDVDFDTDRIKRGHILIPNLCVSIFGGIQPDKLIVYLEQAAYSLANDGMLQRFQVLVYPDPRPWEWRDRVPDKVARDAAYAVFETLADLDPVAWGATPADNSAKFPWFCFDAEAQAEFIAWSKDLHLERMPGEDQPIIQQHLAKFDKLFPALALIFHLAEGAAGPVNKAAALRAAAWCEFLEAHARRCYGLLKDDGLRAAQALAAKLERGALDDGFTLRDVRRNQWRNLTTDDAIQAALDWLEDDAWLRSEPSGGTGPGGGRRTVRYRINPLVLGKRDGDRA